MEKVLLIDESANFDEPMWAAVLIGNYIVSQGKTIEIALRRLACEITLYNNPPPGLKLEHMDTPEPYVSHFHKAKKQRVERVMSKTFLVREV